MAIKPGLQPKLSQKLALTPGLATSLHLLRLPATELAAETRSLAQDNPFLRLDEPATGALVLDPQDVRDEESLGQSLIRQLGMMTLTPEVQMVAAYLVGDLDDRGYLGSGVDLLHHEMAVPAETVTRAISAVQACEPTGIGARDLADCLRLQLEEAGIDPDEARAVCAALDPLFDERWAEAIRVSGLARPRLETLAAQIRTLNPAPADSFTRNAAVFLPEIELIEDPPGTLTAVPHGAMPFAARFDQALAARTGPGDALLLERQRAAQLWLEALAFRSATLRRICQHLADHQTRFFRHGPSEMQPLTQRQIAETLSLHPSTISRAIAGKALEHAGTVYPLARFFSPAIGTKSGKPLSSLAIQHRIRALIAAESGEKPLSDAEIVTQLSREGVDIARRTVAKYRGCLHLPASFKRKRRSSNC